VILIDTNLLLYAADSSSRFHRRARQWVEAAFSGPQPVRLAWVGVLAFLRIATDPRVQTAPVRMQDALAVVNAWMAQPNTDVLAPGERHWAILGDLLTRLQVRGPMVTDAHLAALAIEHGATLATNDRDFSRFPGLRVEYPLDSE